MIKTIVLSVCFAAFSISGTAYAEDVRQYREGPVTEEDYVDVQYAHFEEYIDWLNSTWKPTMEAMKKAGLIIDYQGSDVEVAVDIQQGFAMGLTAELRKAAIAERRTNLMQLWAAEGAPLARALPAGELVATLVREAGLVSG